jgi:cytochrome c biogenesis protein CcmG/thiol:disulfide interchange protein DsbE
MNRFLVPMAAFALLVVVLAIGIDRAPEKSIIQSALLGKAAPEFVLPQLGSDASFDSRSLRGRWYLLNVWGTWCVECRAEHDMLLEIARSQRVPLVGLNWKDEDALALKWLQDLGNPYDHVALDREGRVAIDWGVYGAPETFLVDGDGKVVYKHVGPMTPEVWQRQFLARLPPPASQPLSAPSAPPAAPSSGAAVPPSPAPAS